MSATERSTERLTQLDALRGLAALGVLLYHYTGHFGLMYGHLGAPPFAFEIGRFGVHLFFVISGFVIFMTLERTKHALDFAVSRFSRLFPAFWTALVITLVAVELWGLPGQHVSTRDALLNVTMLPDFFDATEVDGSYWTLQIELFFYAQMLLWYALGGISWIRLILVGWLVLAAVYGIAARLDVLLSHTLREILIVRYIPFFAAGILLYRIYRAPRLQRSDAWLLGACVLAAWAVWSWREALALAVCIGIFRLSIFGRIAFLARQPFLFFGAVSYPIYLLHQDIGFIVITRLEHHGFAPWASILTAFVGVLALATAVMFAIERPAMAAIRGAYRHWRARGGVNEIRGRA